MGTKVNIVIDQGTDFATTVSLTNTAGSQLDLTGMSAAAQMRKTYTSSTAVAFGTLLANNTGSLTLSMNNATTSALSAGRYVYDVELSDSSSVKSRILEGMVTVTPEVTR
jgi:hypothetical protein|tara:strand:+ start:3963 stop:4292 length:330 start_codon:yes stop_codon:yes gene_type:complete